MSETTELADIRAKMRARNAEYEQAKRDLMGRFWSEMREVEEWPDYQARAQKASILQADVDHKLHKLQAALDRDMRGFRADAEEVYDRALQAADALHDEVMHAGDPRTPAQWAEVGARRQLVADELARKGAIDLLAWYLHADARKDDVGTYLGRQIIPGLLDQAVKRGDPRAFEVQGDFGKILRGEADDRRDAALDDARSVMSDIRSPLTELDSARIAEKYGIKRYPRPEAPPNADPGLGPVFQEHEGSGIDPRLVDQAIDNQPRQTGRIK